MSLFTVFHVVYFGLILLTWLKPSRGVWLALLPCAVISFLLGTTMLAIQPSGWVVFGLAIDVWIATSAIKRL